MKNKIAHIVCTFPPYAGGMGNVAFEMSDRLISRGHKVKVFTPKYKKSENSYDYVRRLKPKFSFGNAAYLPQIKRKLSDFDLVHLHYPFYGAAEEVRRWHQSTDTPLVVSYHMDNLSRGLKGLFFAFYRKIYLKKILDSANYLITSSFDYIEHSHASCHYKNNKQKWGEVPFGVDIEKFKPVKSNDLVQKHNLSRKTKTLLFVGGMDKAHSFKGIPVLLKAANKLKERGEDFQVLLVGKGRLQEDYKNLAEKNDLSDVVNFVGYVDDEELSKYYSFADVTILPSINRNEAFGLVLLESMACGTPVIASDLPGVRTIAKQGGEVFEPGSTSDLFKILVNHLNEEVQAKKVREVVKNKYSWRVAMDRLEKIYSKLV